MKGMKLSMLLAVLITVLIAATTNGTAQQWTRVGAPDGTPVYTLLVSDAALLAGTQGGLYRSIDRGATWTLVAPRAFTSLVAAGPSAIVAAAFDGRLLRSIDAGASWSAAASGLPDAATIREVAFDNGGLDVATNLGVYRLERDSATLEPLTMLGLGNASVWGLGVNATDVVALTYSGPYLMSTADTSWRQPSNDPGPFTVAAKRFGGRLYLGTLDGVMISDDNGLTFTDSAGGFVDSAAFAFEVAGPRLFVATSAGVIVTGFGGKWRNVSEGLAGATVLSLDADTSAIFAGSLGGDVFMRSLGAFTGVDDEHSEGNSKALAIESILPTPTSRTMTIRWRTDASSPVRLTLFDSRGAQVASHSSLEAGPGRHEASLDVSGLASGVYQCLITDGVMRDWRAVVVAR